MKHFQFHQPNFITYTYDDTVKLMQVLNDFDHDEIISSSESILFRTRFVVTWNLNEYKKQSPKCWKSNGMLDEKKKPYLIECFNTNTSAEK